MKSASTLQTDLTISTSQLQAPAQPGAKRRAQKRYLCQVANKSPAHANVSLLYKSWGYQRTLGTTDRLEDFSDRCISSSGGCCSPFLAPHHILIHCSLLYVRTSVIARGFLQYCRKVCWQQAALLGSKPNCNTNTNSYNLR